MCKLSMCQSSWELDCASGKRDVSPAFGSNSSRKEGQILHLRSYFFFTFPVAWSLRLKQKTWPAWEILQHIFSKFVQVSKKLEWLQWFLFFFVSVVPCTSCYKKVPLWNDVTSFCTASGSTGHRFWSSDWTVANWNKCKVHPVQTASWLNLQQRSYCWRIRRENAGSYRNITA